MTTIETILRYLNNYFYRFGEYGEQNIKINKLKVKGAYRVGEYVKIVGSLYNDGVYQVIGVEVGSIVVAGELSDEDFTGTIFSLAIPKRIKEIAEQIQEFNRQLSASGFESESFGDYSYTRAKNKNGELMGWKDIFKSELALYRKSFESTRGVLML